MFKSCSWEKVECDPAYIKKEYTDMGLCYIVNWNPLDVLYARKTGEK